MTISSNRLLLAILLARQNIGATSANAMNVTSDTITVKGTARKTSSYKKISIKITEQTPTEIIAPSTKAGIKKFKKYVNLPLLFIVSKHMEITSAVPISGFVSMMYGVGTNIRGIIIKYTSIASPPGAKNMPIKSTGSTESTKQLIINPKAPRIPLATHIRSIPAIKISASTIMHIIIVLSEPLRQAILNDWGISSSLLFCAILA